MITKLFQNIKISPKKGTFKILILLKNFKLIFGKKFAPKRTKYKYFHPIKTTPK